MKRKVVYALAVLITILNVVFIFNSMSTEEVVDKIKRCKVDLYCEDIENIGMVKLDGTWDMYWKKYLSYEEILEGEKRDAVVRLPFSWKKTKVGEETIGDYGHATFVLKVNGNRENMAIYAPNIAASYELYVNEKLMMKQGKITEFKEGAQGQYGAKLKTGINLKTGDYIILKVANYTQVGGGVWNSIFLGETDKLLRYVEKERITDFGVFTILIFMSLYYAYMHFFAKWNKSALYFSIISLAFGLRTIATRSILMTFIFENLNWEVTLKTLYLTYIIGILMFLRYLNELFKDCYNKKPLYIVKSITIIFSLIVLLTKVSFYSKTLIVYQVISILIILYAIKGLIKAFKKREAGSEIMLLSVIIISNLTLHDILVASSILQTQYIAIWGYLIFIISQAIFIASEYSKSRQKIEEAFERFKTIQSSIVKREQVQGIEMLAAGMAHEINNPLGFIMSNNEVLEDFVEIYKEKVVECFKKDQNKAEQAKIVFEEIIEMIKDNKEGLERIKNIVENLRVFSKIETIDKISYYDIEEEINIIMSMLQDLVQKANIKVKFNFEKTNRIKANGVEINQAIMQILLNSIYALEKIKREEKLIKINLKSDEKFLYLKIYDNGIGIKKENVPKVTEPFFTTKPVGEGVGLGLSICLEIIKGHGGDLKIESEFKNFTEVEIKLPIK